MADCVTFFSITAFSLSCFIFLVGLFTGSCSCEHCCSFSFSVVVVVVVCLMCILSIFVYLSLTLSVYQLGTSQIHTFVRSYALSFGRVWFDSTRLDMLSMHGNFIKQFSITSCKAKSTLELQCIYLRYARVRAYVPNVNVSFFVFERKVHRDGVE